ncbi:sporulation related protein [Rhodovulum bhavnagarense]|uniref:Sporulation related protein n=1 Tax=Rhodovulum bhavnagarense TaxID=992286 RepID=A0A4R2RGC5_9RHOB|nr:SPOR domain-containing protein [Rhodovulum bhavnagarense]TCP61983.1 sporulation related protein [Rhodovulum bhavnagarense]
MADIEFDAVDYDDAGGGPPLIATLTMWAGGVVSLALVAGLATWGYRITVRDMTGVPVVQALEGPIRVAPDEPGGQLAVHQGLAVNRIAAVGEAAPPADELRLAPMAVALAEEDMARGDLLPAPQFAAVASGQTVQPAPGGGADIRAVDAPLEEIDDMAPRADALPRLPAGALARSPRPAPRPEGDLVARAAVAAATAAIAPAPAVELSPQEIIAGTVLVQLGAFDSPEDARSTWGGLTDSFADFFDQKMRVVQQSESGGRQFYRLRATGFADMADARRFCAALMAEGADCIPVVAR